MLTLMEAIKSSRLQEFIAQEEARGVGRAVVHCAMLEAVVFQ